jgi:hypothetical protein
LQRNEKGFTLRNEMKKGLPSTQALVRQSAGLIRHTPSGGEIIRFVNLRLAEQVTLAQASIKLLCAERLYYSQFFEITP